MLTVDELPDCPVATTLRLVGNKWKILIIQRLLQRPYRFNELHRSIEGISQKVLTENLRQLEADDIVVREVYPEVPVRVEYSLSPVAETMRPIIGSMEQWGLWHQEEVRSKAGKAQ